MDGDGSGGEYNNAIHSAFPWQKCSCESEFTCKRNPIRRINYSHLGCLLLYNFWQLIWTGVGEGGRTRNSASRTSPCALIPRENDRNEAETLRVRNSWPIPQPSPFTPKIVGLSYCPGTPSRFAIKLQSSGRCECLFGERICGWMGGSSTKGLMNE